MKKYRILSIMAVVWLVSALVSAAFAAPKAEIWQRWTVYDSKSNLTVDHGPWNRFLNKHVAEGDDGINLVDYKAVSQDDKEALDRYVSSLEDTPVGRLNKNEQLAFWLNLYNSLTVKVILDHYPVDSIMDIDISPGIFSSGPWGKKLVSVEGQPLSLDDIEHRILRPIWKEPRIHYGVNCASIGCPNLRRVAFTSENADGLLSQGAVEYVNHPRGAKVENGKLTVSSIYEWFQEDFGGNDRGVIEHLKKWAKPELLEKLEKLEKISGDDYDWSLNETR